jgi:hypothetical protein
MKDVGNYLDISSILFGIFYGPLVVILVCLFPVLVYCTNKSLATLIEACAHGPALFLRGKQMK